MSWLRRIRGALGMSLVWAAGGFGVGGLIELIYNLWPGFPLGPLFDIWPAVLASTRGDALVFGLTALAFIVYGVTLITKLREERARAAAGGETR